MKIKGFNMLYFLPKSVKFRDRDLPETEKFKLIFIFDGFVWSNNVDSIIIHQVTIT